MDDLNFCPTCGKNLSPGTAYCPACGARLNDPEGERREKAATERDGGERIKIAVILLLITAAISIISGIYFYVNAAEMADWMANLFSDPALSDDIFGPMEGFFRMTGLLAIIGGAVAITSAFLAYKRRLWFLAFILCIVAAAIGNLIIGLVALYMLYKARAVFKD
ncbi:MAG: zinc ribbon domain-containing protein [Methanomassiliicoccaceae archaeon]|jgi:hypothetical protein|nr:zinc ribbon domain-containing protein [Methanomassiliicoccaceae archaeon]